MNDTDTSLRAALGAIAGGASLDETLREIAETVVERLGAGSCKVWLVKQGDACATCELADACHDRSMCLHLKASVPGLGVEHPRVPLVVFRDRTAAHGGSARASRNGAAGRLLFGADEVEQAGGDAYTLVPLKGPAGVVGLMGVLASAPLTAAATDALRGFSDAAIVAVRLADLTSRHQRATMQLEESAEERAEVAGLLHAILYGSTEYNVIAEDLDGRVTVFSEGARTAYGYAPEELIGRVKADVLYAPEEVRSGRVVEILNEATRTGRCEAVVTRLRKNGDRFSARATFTVRRDGEGDPSGIVVVERDLSSEGASARRAEAATEREAELRDHVRALSASHALLEREADRLRAELAAAPAPDAGPDGGEPPGDEQPPAAEARPGDETPSGDEPPSFVFDASEALLYGAGLAEAEGASERLRAAGREVAAFSDVAGALDHARRVRPGVAVVDLTAAGAWPFVDVLARGGFTPGVVALGEESDRGAALARGACAFVARGAGAGALDRAIERAEGRRAAVLLVADDPASRGELAALLDHPAFALDVRPGWSAAREAVLAGPPSAIVLDLCLPGATGFALLDLVRAMPTRLPPVVLVVARDASPAERRAHAVCSAVLQRGAVDRERLLAAVDRAVETGR